MSALHRVAIALGLVLALTALAFAPAAAAPPPEELCGVCGEEFETAATDAGVPLAVEHGTLDLTIREDGAGHWDARVDLSESAADRLAANESLRDHVVRETYDHGRTVVDEPRNLDTAVENGTLVVSFDVPGVAERGPGGVLLVSLLHRGGTDGSVRLVADRVTISGPDASRVTSGVEGMRTEGDAVVWTATSDDDVQGLPQDALLAFAPGDGIAGAVATFLAKVTFVAGNAGLGFFAVVGTPLLALGLAVGGLLELGGRVPRAEPRRLAGGLAATGLVGGGTLVAASVLAVDLPTAGIAGLAAIYLLIAGVAAFDDRPSLGRLVGYTAAMIGVVAVVAIATDALVAVALAVPVALFLPLGYVGVGTGRTRQAILAVVLVIPALLAAGLLSLTTPSVAPLLVVALLAWVALAAVLGTPLFVLGRELAAGATGGN